jgi:hypothetical protein
LKDIQKKIKSSRIGGFVYRNSLVSFLAVSRAVQRLDYPIYNHWKSFMETVKVSSDVFYAGVTFLDDDIEEEFEEKQEKVNSKLGIGKMYEKDQIDKLREEKEKALN